MREEIFNIWENDSSVLLTAFIDDSYPSGRTAIIALPGGGYHICAPNEGNAVAQRFAKMGYAGFALQYSVMDVGNAPEAVNPHTVFPEPLLEVGAAIGFIRKNAERFGVDPEKIVLAGFSAGGHLAACFGNMWSSSDVYAPLGLTPDDIRPNALILGYGATELTPDGDMTVAAFGKKTEYTDEMLRRLSGKHNVGLQTPPTMLWHCVTDPDVPVQSSLDMAQALENAGVPYEVHLFGCGGHAFGLGDGSVAGAWVPLADTFMRGILTRPQAYDKAYVASLGPFGE